MIDKLSKEELKIVEQYSTITGTLKKKRKDSNLVKLVSSSYDAYFRFFCYGRFLAYFTKEPVDSSF